MRWDRFFEDLEDQLASEWEAERVALESESERLRLSRVQLRDRICALAPAAPRTSHADRVGDPPPPSFEFGDGTILAADVAAVGRDWVALEPAGAAAGMVLAPLASVQAIAATHGELLRTARPPAADTAGSLADRMALGFVLRDLARRRVPVTIHLIGGRSLSGTIDRVGADHLDLALHEPGGTRRASEVTGFRIVPLAPLAWLRVEGGARALLP